MYIVLAACWVAWWCCVVFDDSDESAQGNNVPDDADAEADAIEQKAKEIYERDESACSHKASPCFQLVFDGLRAFPSHPGLVQAGLTLLELQHNGDGDLRAAIDLIGAALADPELGSRGDVHHALLLTERGLALRDLQRPHQALLALQAAAELTPTNRELREEIDDCFNEVDAVPIRQRNLHNAAIFSGIAATANLLDKRQFMTTHRLTGGRPALSRIDGLLNKTEIQSVLDMSKYMSSRLPPIFCMPSLEVATSILSDRGVQVSKMDVLNDLRHSSEKRNSESVCFNKAKSAELAAVLEYSTSIEFHYGHDKAFLNELGARIETSFGLPDEHGAAWMITTYAPNSSGYVAINFSSLFTSYQAPKEVTSLTTPLFYIHPNRSCEHSIPPPSLPSLSSSFFKKNFQRYSVHNDCGSGPKLDRIATVLVYLTDVDAGGATVFTNVQEIESARGGGNGKVLKVHPRAGSAAIWKSMKKNGKCDEHALHFAERVGDGSSKVILQRWYHQEGALCTRTHHSNNTCYVYLCIVVPFLIYAA